MTAADDSENIPMIHPSVIILFFAPISLLPTWLHLLLLLLLLIAIVIVIYHSGPGLSFALCRCRGWCLCQLCLFHCWTRQTLGCRLTFTVASGCIASFGCIFFKVLPLWLYLEKSFLNGIASFVLHPLPDNHLCGPVIDVPRHIRDAFAHLKVRNGYCPLL